MKIHWIIENYVFCDIPDCLDFGSPADLERCPWKSNLTIVGVIYYTQEIIIVFLKSSKECTFLAEYK